MNNLIENLAGPKSVFLTPGLDDLVNQAFGYVGNLNLFRADIDGSGKQVAGDGLNVSIDKQAKVNDGSAALQLSSSGVPSTSGRKSRYGVAYTMPIQIGGVWLPNEPIVTITRNKTIVETDLLNGGTVKERMATGDAEIQIEGLAMAEDGSGTWPEQELASLQRIASRNYAQPVNHLMLSLFNVHRVVVKSLDIMPIAGQIKAVPYRLLLVSDNPINYKRIKP